MQPDIALETAPESAGDPSYVERIRATVGKLAAKMSRDLDQGGFSTGELAELRRLDSGVGVPSTSLTFWRVVVGELETNGLVGERAETEAFRPWLSILRAMAELAGHHRPGARLGGALHSASVSEMRLVRLLRAEGQDLMEQLRPLTHQLRSAGVDADVRDIAELVLSDAARNRTGRGSGKWNERIRRQIASAYFRAENQSDRSETNE